jgi:hypothetical protein
MRLPPVIMDVTRLATRLGRAVPNGIDRVDIAYAKHFLGGHRDPANSGGAAGADDAVHDVAGALIGFRGRPRWIGREVAASLVESVEAGWGEHADNGAASPRDRASPSPRTTRLGRLRRAASL